MEQAEIQKIQKEMANNLSKKRKELNAPMIGGIDEDGNLFLYRNNKKMIVYCPFNKSSRTETHEYECNSPPYTRTGTFQGNKACGQSCALFSEPIESNFYHGDDVSDNIIKLKLCKRTLRFLKSSFQDLRERR